MNEQSTQHHPPLRAQPAAQTTGHAAAGPQQAQLAALSSTLNANRTGLPDRLKAGVESLSGLSMDPVRVHYNSGKPAQLNAQAYAQGSEIHVGPGQERHLPHEAWHVVQQAQGRVRATLQLKTGAAVNDDGGLEREADTMGRRASAGVTAAAKSTHLPACAAGGNVLQRVVDDYQPGTLRYNTKAMRNLDAKQMKIVQQLHDDPSHAYTIDEARAIATGSSSVSASNPYAWDVTGIGGSYAVGDAGVQSVLESFGHPTQSVVKTYGDLAGRVGYEAGKSRKGVLSASTVTDLHSVFDASMPLHLGFNPFLNATWSGNLDDYGGAKTGIPLYSVMRSEVTKDFAAQPLGNVSLNEILKEVSGRPFELHHVAYKAHYPEFATTPENLMLTQRSEKESVHGPGQHELMHMVSSGQHHDKFNELLPQVVQTYDDWLKARKGSGLF